MTQNYDLYKAFEDKSFGNFVEALEVFEADPNACPKEGSNTTFELILKTPDSACYIEKCIEHGADFYVKNVNYKFPIHYLIRSNCVKNLKAVEPLLLVGQSDDKNNIKASPHVNVKDMREQNCLHLLAESLNHEKNEIIFELIFMLLSYGCNINSPNDEGETPFFIIARELPHLQNSQEIFDKLLHSTEIDFYTHRGNDIVKMVKNKYKDEIPEKENFTVCHENLKKLLKTGNINKFETLFAKYTPFEDDETFHNNCIYYMEIAVQKSYINIVDLLIKKGIDFNRTSEENKKDNIPPPFFAYREANFPIFNLFLIINDISKSGTRKTSYSKKPRLSCYTIEPYCKYETCEKTLLHQFFSNYKSCSVNLRYSDTKIPVTIKMDRNQKKCFDSLINNPICDRDYLNALDKDKKPVVYYSVKYGLDYMTLKLLQKGAYIQPVMTNIRKSLLSDLLDSCITANDKFYDDADFEITIKYGFLVPSQVRCQNVKNDEIETANEVLQRKQISLTIFNEPKPGTSKDTEAPPSDSDTHKKKEEPTTEMHALHLLAENHDYRSLVAHPVLSSFVFLKWKKIRFLLHINLVITLFYIFTFIPYIIISQDVQNELVHKVFYGLSFTSLLFLIAREILQFSQFKFKYFIEYSNWIDIVIVICSVLVLFPMSLRTHSFRMIHTTIILLEIWEYFNLLGYLPILSVSLHTKIFRNVFATFIKSLGFYSVMIVGFALAFHTLNGHKAITMNDSVSFNITDDLNSFASIRGSIVKSFVMLTGELDASNIHLKGFTYIGLFGLFVFIVTIVLNNLLNALAVSDTQEITSDAKLIDLHQRIKVMHQHEKTIFKGTSYLSKRLQNVISLFAGTIKNEKISLKPKIDRNTHTGGESIQVDWLPSIFCYFGRHMTMEEEIIKDMKTLLVKKREEHNDQIERIFRIRRSEKVARDIIILNEQVAELSKALVPKSDKTTVKDNDTKTKVTIF